MAQIEGGTNHRLMPDATKIGIFISQFTKAVAETPFKYVLKDDLVDD